MLTVEEARSKAKTLLSQVALGGNPLAEREILRSIPTLADFVRDRYLPHIKGYKTSWRVDDTKLRLHIIPQFGKLPLDQIDTKKLIGFREVLRAKGLCPASNNRVLIILRALMNRAIEWETPGVTKNPLKGFPMLTENSRRERYLTAEETERLYAAVCTSGNTQLQHIVPMLILTGARKREVLDSKWEDFDLARRQWRIPKSKSGHHRFVPVSEGLAQLLAKVPRFEGCPYVLPNPDSLMPYTSIYDPWNVARKKAGLADVRIHDLRHSFASFLINAGRQLYEVQKILGHAQIATTQRYAHLSQATLLAAANSAGAVLANVFSDSRDKPPRAPKSAADKQVGSLEETALPPSPSE